MVNKDFHKEIREPQGHARSMPAGGSPSLSLYNVGEVQVDPPVIHSLSDITTTICTNAFVPAASLSLSETRLWDDIAHSTMLCFLLRKIRTSRRDSYQPFLLPCSPPLPPVYFVLFARFRAVGTAQADPAAAGPIIWLARTFVFTLYQFSRTWVDSSRIYAIIRQVFNAKMHPIRFPQVLRLRPASWI